MSDEKGQSRGKGGKRRVAPVVSSIPPWKMREITANEMRVTLMTRIGG